MKAKKPFSEMSAIGSRKYELKGAFPKRKSPKKITPMHIKSKNVRH